jgi:hypothetical protein
VAGGVHPRVRAAPFVSAVLAVPDRMTTQLVTRRAAAGRPAARRPTPDHDVLESAHPRRIIPDPYFRPVVEHMFDDRSAACCAHLLTCAFKISVTTDLLIFEVLFKGWLGLVSLRRTAQPHHHRGPCPGRGAFNSPWTGSSVVVHGTAGRRRETRPESRPVRSATGQSSLRGR